MPKTLESAPGRWYGGKFSFMGKLRYVRDARRAATLTLAGGESSSSRLRRMKQWILEDFIERSVATGGSYGPAVSQRVASWQAAGFGCSRFSSTQDFGTLGAHFCEARSR